MTTHRRILNASEGPLWRNEHVKEHHFGVKAALGTKSYAPFTVFATFPNDVVGVFRSDLAFGTIQVIQL